jgi:hypothetical protein
MTVKGLLASIKDQNLRLKSSEIPQCLLNSLMTQILVRYLHSEGLDYRLKKISVKAMIYWDIQN